MRSAAEIRFRLVQEAANLWLAVTKPAPALDTEWPLPGLPPAAPVAAALRGSRFAASIERWAGVILQHRFPLLGIEIDTGDSIRWRRDYVNGRETGTRYFRFIPYLDFERVGDHKIIWELNRHQHLVAVAQALLFTGREDMLRELIRQWESWAGQNPFQRGINWASALEVAFRALSWIWVYHLVGDRMESAFRARFLTELFRHGCYLEWNLSVYFSPNTHLLGEAVALHALGALFPRFPRARRWRETGARIVEAELHRQVRADGAHFEQSSYYHVYALDFFLFHYVVAGKPAVIEGKLRRMAEYLDALLGPGRSLPQIGDDDGGRLFHPYGRHDRYGRATLATCGLLLNRRGWLRDSEDACEQAAWWLGPAALARKSDPPELPASRLFDAGGMASLCGGCVSVLVDAGGFGPFRAGHSHSDALSIVVRNGEEEILIDPGTYTYVGGADWREWFRGSAAHNTVRVDGRNQSVACGPFAWAGKPRVAIRQWTTSRTRDFLDAECAYFGTDLLHRRRVLYLKPDLIFVLDEIDGPNGPHRIEQFWHPGEVVALRAPACYRIGRDTSLVLDGAATVSLDEQGWRSRVFGSKIAAAVIVAVRECELPAAMGVALVLGGREAPWSVDLRGSELHLRGPRGVLVRFGEGGEPSVEVE